jgi:ABC-type nitrate/sulfonate/bicarbonate transport system permease component
MTTKWARAAAPVLVIAVVWELTARYSGVSPALFPSLVTIGQALLRMAAEGSLLTDIGGTLGRLFQAVFIGAAIGTVLGATMGYVRAVEQALVLPVNFLLSIPGTALFPLALIWLGLSETAIIAILIYEVVLTVAVTTWSGAKSVDPSLVRAARALGASGAGMVFRALIPATLPAIITSYRLAFSRAWRILIIAEMMVSVTSGLGYRLYWAREFFHYDVVYAGLIVVGLLGLLIERLLLRSLERVTIERWGTMRDSN